MGLRHGGGWFRQYVGTWRDLLALVHDRGGLVASRNIDASVRALRQAVDERRTSADAYRQASVPKSDELRRIAQVSYEAGERGILELLDAYRTAADARLRLLDLDAATALAEIELVLATAVEIRK